MSNRPAWHYNPDVSATVEDFYHKYARQPDSSEAKQNLQHKLDTIRSHLKEQGVPFREFQYLGSTYEGLKVDDGLEFDVFVVLDGNGFKVNPTRDPQYDVVEPDPGVSHGYFQSFNTFKHQGVESAEGITRKFQGYMAKLAATTDEFSRENVVFRKHGPAIQMDVHRNDAFWFSADLVPTLRVEDNYYVAKPHRQYQDAWLHSYSVEMKQMLESMDRDNGRRKQVLRTLKAMCHRESNLQRLSSHHLKMLLFTELEENPDKSWQPSELAPRLLDLVKRVETNVDSGHYSHHFLPQVNMMGAIPRNTMCRMKNLYYKETSFMKAMTK